MFTVEGQKPFLTVPPPNLFAKTLGVPARLPPGSTPWLLATLAQATRADGAGRRP